MDTQETPELSLHERVQQSLNAIRPALQMDGGDCEIVEITPDGIVKLRLQGACGGCPSSTMTLSFGIERRLKSEVPEITKVVAV